MTAAFFSAPVPAQEKKVMISVKFAVINIDHIRRNATVAKDIRSQISGYRDAFRVSIQKEEEDIRKANQELARQRSILSPEAFAEERRKFEQHLAEVQRTVQERKNALDKVRGDALRVVQSTLNEIVVEVARENNLILILRSDQVVFWAKQMDITELVLKRVDAKLPKLKVATPGQ